MLTVNIIDNAFKHCLYSNNPSKQHCYYAKTELPIQISSNMSWNRDIDLSDTTKPLFATENDIINKDFLNFKGKKIAWLLEPSLNKHLSNWVLSNNNLYDVILTHNKELSNKISNSIYVPFGGCWISSEDWGLHKKTKNISIVASSKKELIGHRLRHKVIDKFPDIELFGEGYNPIDNKITSLRDYKYQIVIENSRIPGYFTEKLIDCFITGTIPIYYGDPLIGDCFNTNGILQFSNTKILSKILQNLPYIDNEVILNNFNLAKQYILCEDYIFNNNKQLYL